MKLIRLTRGTDRADLRGEPQFQGDKTTKGPDGADIPRFLFVSLEGRSRDTDLKGWPHVVTDAEAEELLTFPGLTFEEVSIDQANADRRRYMPRGGSEVGRQVFGDAAYEPVPVLEFAEIVERDPGTIKTEVQTEIKAEEVKAEGEPRDPEAIQAEVQAEIVAHNERASVAVSPTDEEPAKETETASAVGRATKTKA